MFKKILTEDRNINRCIIIAYVENIITLFLPAIVLMFNSCFGVILIPLVIINWNFIKRIHTEKKIVICSLLGVYEKTLYYR